MTDLSRKFENTLQQLAEQHTELIGKLNEVLTALGAPPATPAVTLADVLEELQSMNNRLLALSNAVGHVPSDSGFSLLTQVAGLLGRIGIPTGDATTTVLGRLAAIESASTATATALGIPTGDATTTALGYLAAIQSCICALAGEIPGEPDSSDCESPYTSTYTWLLEQTQGGGGGSPGVSFMFHVAAFATPLPAGLEEDTLYGLTPPSGTVSELAPATSWDGWKVFVKSASSTYSDGITGSPRYPTGEWRDLAGSGSLVFSVYMPNDITVYLCGPENGGNGGGGEPITDCTTFESSVVNVQPRENTKSQVDAIQLPEVFTTDNVITFTDFDPYVFGENIVILNDLYGYSVGLESGGLVFIAGVAADNSTIAHIIHTGEGGYVFTQHTQRVMFTREVNIGTPDGAFSIELCPPEPI